MKSPSLSFLQDHIEECWLCKEAQVHFEALSRGWDPEIPDFNCVVCGESAREKFRIKDDVWRTADVDNGHVHLACLEKKLGRQISIKDFDETAEINRPLFFLSKKNRV